METIQLEKMVAYKHTGVVERIERTTTLSKEQAEVLFEDTKQFLYLCARHPEVTIPTKALDEGWHNFILFTEDYANFCETILGKFVHHRPTSPKDSVPERQQAAYESMLRIATGEFGTTLSSNWTASNPTCCVSEDGGTTNCQDPK